MLVNLYKQVLREAIGAHIVRTYGLSWRTKESKSPSYAKQYSRCGGRRLRSCEGVLQKYYRRIWKYNSWLNKYFDSSVWSLSSPHRPIDHPSNQPSEGHEGAEGSYNNDWVEDASNFLLMHPKKRSPSGQFYVDSPSFSILIPSPKFWRHSFIVAQN